MINEIQRFIGDVSQGVHLSEEQAVRAFQIIMMGAATPAQIAALLTALRMKGETVAEITGAAKALRAKMQTITAPPGALDVCGTGGDNSGSLNVSTAVALVVAACGVPVVKHGNKSVSSRSGSADVLAALGVNIQAEEMKAQQALNEAGICFLFAPLYHKAMRHVAPIRQELGVRTIFNILGPLVNPAQPRLQLMGVYDAALLEPMAQVLRALGSERAWVVHGNDGLDELTITGASHVAELAEGQVTLFEVTPEEAGLTRADAEALKGSHAQANAQELTGLLSGKHSAYRNIVVFNAAAGLIIAGKAQNLQEGATIAADAIDCGKAQAVLASLVRITNA